MKKFKKLCIMELAKKIFYICLLTSSAMFSERLMAQSAIPSCIDVCNGTIETYAPVDNQAMCVANCQPSTGNTTTCQWITRSLTQNGTALTGCCASAGTGCTLEE